MTQSEAQLGSVMPRLWCIAASHAPIVAVIARYYGSPRWTCVLRWNWEAQTVDEGAWTKMHLRAHRCSLTPDGEFFLYHAEGGTDGPFSAINGGAFAVSRLPWLAALTDPDTFGPAGAAKSRDALSRRAQRKLWSKFADGPGWLQPIDWPRHLGPEWTPLPAKLASQHNWKVHGPDHLAAISEIHGTGLALIAAVTANRNKHDETHWSIWNDDIRFYVASRSSPSQPPIDLHGVRWAHACGKSRVLIATDDACLKLITLSSSGDQDPATQTLFEHSLRSLTPNPRPAPDWAKSRLPFPWW